MGAEICVQIEANHELQNQKSDLKIPDSTTWTDLD